MFGPRSDPWAAFGHASAEDEEKVIVSSLNRYCWLFSCCALGCSYSTILMLRKDVVLRHDKTLCGERISVRQYGELGRIESGQCCCFVCVDSNLGTIIPSFGCDRDAVNCIISELRERVVKRGDAAQLEISKLVVAKTIEINDKIDIIARHLTGNQFELSAAPTVLTIDER